MQSASGRTTPLLLSHLPLLLLPLLLLPLLLLPLPVLLLLPPLQDTLEVDDDIPYAGQVQSLPGLLPGRTEETVGLGVPGLS